jgi:hypothetical protein
VLRLVCALAGMRVAVGRAGMGEGGGAAALGEPHAGPSIVGATVVAPPFLSRSLLADALVPERVGGWVPERVCVFGGGGQCGWTMEAWLMFGMLLLPPCVAVDERQNTWYVSKARLVGCSCFVLYHQCDGYV